MISEVVEHRELVETCQKITIDELVRKTSKMLKKQIVEAQIEALGIPIKLTTSKTRFNGERLWFVCPYCSKRIHTLYENLSGNIGCRKCLGLSYKKSRYKGMIECT